MTTLAKIPAPLDLAATVGSDLVVAVTVNENDAPYNFTSNTIETVIYNLDGTANASNFTTSTLNNVLTLTLSDIATTALGADSFTYEVRVTKDNTTSPWLGGTLSIIPRGVGGGNGTSTTLNLTTAPAVTLNLAVGFGVIPDAEAVPFTASDPLTETNVQDALDELATAVAPRIPTVKSSIYIVDNTTPTVLDVNTPTKVAGTFLAGPACSNCIYDSNRVTYIGTRNTRVLANCVVDINNINNQTVVIEVRKNGQAVNGLSTKVRVGNTVATGAITGMIDIVEDDYLELWITNTTSGDDPIVSGATITFMN